MDYFKLKITLFFSALMLIQSLIGYALFQQVKDNDQSILAAIQAMTL
jgi:CHASE3 domain sensor protein